MDGDRSLGYAGEVDFGPAAAVDGNLADDFFALRRRWFDCWVKGIDNGVDREPAVRVFVMGGGLGRKTAAGRLDHGGFWRDGADWPLPGTQWTRFHLRADRSLSETLPEESAPPLVFTADPRDPVPTISAPDPRSLARDRLMGRSPRGLTCCPSRQHRSRPISKWRARSSFGSGSPPTAPIATSTPSSSMSTHPIRITCMASR